jgi:hypothetical protein
MERWNRTLEAGEPVIHLLIHQHGGPDDLSS